MRTITYRYDPFGRRVGKEVTDTDGGSTTVRTTAYLYDAEDIVFEFADATVDGVPPPQVVTHYVHGPGIDEPLAVSDGSFYELNETTPAWESIPASRFKPEVFGASQFHYGDEQAVVCGAFPLATVPLFPYSC